MLKAAEQNEFYSKLGKKIRAIRVEQKIKQETLATHVGFTRISISNIETGRQKIQLHTLIELADYLKTPIQELIPSIELVKSELSSRIEKKISNTEVSNNSQAMEKIKDFILYSSNNFPADVSRKSIPAKNRAKGK